MPATQPNTSPPRSTTSTPRWTTAAASPGPPPRKPLKAASTFQGAILGSRDWKKVLANREIQAYDNPDRAVGCRFDPTSRPPCQNDTAQDARTEPDLANCQNNCFSRFYTDVHAREHARKPHQLDAWADLAPEPEAIRLRRIAQEHRDAADQHWTTRMGPDGTPIPPPTPNPAMDDSA